MRPLLMSREGSGTVLTGHVPATNAPNLADADNQHPHPGIVRDDPRFQTTDVVVQWHQGHTAWRYSGGSCERACK